MENTDENLFKERLPDIGSTILKKTRKICSLSTISDKFPILKWLPRYKLSYVFGDFIAGFTVGLTTIPQAIAYGFLAGLEPQYGLYSAFMGCFMYIIFGSCKDVTIATTAIMAIMVHQYAVLSPDYAILICFLAGCIILLMGLLNLGVLVQLISIPVITGFMLAAATTIGSAQINNLFGIKSPSNEFLPSWKHFFTHLSAVSLNDAILGVSTLVFLLILKKIKDMCLLYKSLWKYISLSRNALAVIIGTLLAYLLTDGDYHPFKVTGNITAGLPPFRMPKFSTTVNGTEVLFPEMMSTIGASLASIPLVAILEIVAISKAFSRGKIVNASQEMIALGMCNIMGSFVLSMPVTGSFTRTAVNHSSGVNTPLGGAVTGTLVLMALAFLTQTFYYIPKSTLAAIIIAAMLSLVELDKIADIWKSKKRDLLPFFVTTITCLFWSLEYGILCGVAANLAFIFYRSARPQIFFHIENINNQSVGIVTLKQSLDFAAAEYLKERVLRFACEFSSEVRLIILKGTEIGSIDYTVAMHIIDLKKDLDVLVCDLVCCDWSIEAAGVICRLDKKLRSIFKFNVAIQEIVMDFNRNSKASFNDVYTSN